MLVLKTVTYAQISPKMVNPRDIAGNAEQEKEEEEDEEEEEEEEILLTEFGTKQQEKSAWG